MVASFTDSTRCKTKSPLPLDFTTVYSFFGFPASANVTFSPTLNVFLLPVFNMTGPSYASFTLNPNDVFSLYPFSLPSDFALYALSTALKNLVVSSSLIEPISLPVLSNICINNCWYSVSSETTFLTISFSCDIFIIVKFVLSFGLILLIFLLYYKY